MKDEYTLKYNAFGNVLLLTVWVTGTFMVLVFGTLLVALAVIAAEGILFYFLCQRTYLTIDSEGIHQLHE